MKINYYFLNGEHVEIETDDKFAIVVAECERLEHNLERKERYHSCSLEEREEYGIQHGKNDEGIESLFSDEMFSQTQIEKLYKAINELTKSQREVIMAIFFDGSTQEEYAKSKGIKQATVSITLRRALNNLKKFL